MKPLWAQVWLIIRNDLRLTWRDLLTSRWKDFASYSLFAVLFILANVGAIGLFFMVGKQPSLQAEMFAWLFFGFTMLGATMNQAVTVLFERADFDLLLASPISPRAILFARLGTISIAAAASVFLFLIPLLNGAWLAISPSYLCGYLVWLLLACAVASLGIVGTLGLVRLLGVRRARTWTQVVAGVLGASVYLTFQLTTYLRDELRDTVTQSLRQVVAYSGAGMVARAARGEPLPLLALVVVTLVLAVVTTRTLARLFVEGVQEAGAVNTPARKRPSREYGFSESIFGATFRKDVRLILRDPLLLAQVLPTTLYIVPGLLGFIRYGMVTLLGPLAVLLAVQFSSMLTYVAASGEECWDLIRMSPSSELKLRHAKMAAGMVLPVGVAALISIAIAFLGLPGTAALTLGLSISCAAACAWLQVTRISPTPRRDILKRANRRNNIGRNLVTALITLLGAVSVGLVGAHHWIAGLATSGACLVTVIACFTLVEVEEVETAVFESAAAQSESPSAT